MTQQQQPPQQQMHASVAAAVAAVAQARPVPIVKADQPLSTSQIQAVQSTSYGLCESKCVTQAASYHCQSIASETFFNFKACQGFRLRIRVSCDSDKRRGNGCG
jgi:hypothetical protein